MHNEGTFTKLRQHSRTMVELRGRWEGLSDVFRICICFIDAEDKKLPFPVSLTTHSMKNPYKAGVLHTHSGEASRERSRKARRGKADKKYKLQEINVKALLQGVFRNVTR